MNTRSRMLLLTAGLLAVSGCSTLAPKHGAGLVPPGATLMATGYPELTVVVSRPGSLYVVDETSGALPVSAQVGFVSESEAGIIYVSDQIGVRSLTGDANLSLAKLPDGSQRRYAIWFLEDTDKSGSQTETPDQTR